MKRVVCEVCGSQNVKKFEEEFVCLECGVSYSVEAARKLLVEVTEDQLANKLERVKNSSESKPVEKPTMDDELKELYGLARRAYSGDNFEAAEKYYYEISRKNPRDWEATFYEAISKAWVCKIRELGIETNRVCGAAKNAIELINLYITDEQERAKAYNAVVSNCIRKATQAFNVSTNWYESCAFYIKYQFVQDYINYAYPSVTLLYTVADMLESKMELSSQLKNNILSAYKTGIEMHNTLLRNLADKDKHRNTIIVYANKLARYGIRITLK